MNFANSLLTILLLAFLACPGCCPSKPATLLERDGSNNVRFHSPETGLSASVSVAPAFHYQKEAKGEVGGATLAGPLFNDGRDYVLVTEVSKGDYVKLGGKAFEPALDAVRPMEPSLAYHPDMCLLNYTVSAIIGEDVVGAIVIRDMAETKGQNRTCGPWKDLGELADQQPDIVKDFEAAASRAVQASW